MNPRPLRPLSLVALIATLALALSAPAARTSAPGRWHSGVTDTQKRAAQAALEDGNKLLTLALFVPSLVCYRRALTHWDHPGLHLNIAKALLNLDRVEEALAHLWRALEFEGGGLSRETADSALRYQKLILAEVAHVVIVVPSSATVTLGDRALVVGPGRWEGALPAGRVTLHASTSTIPLALELVGGRKLDIFWRDVGEPWVVDSAQDTTTNAQLMRALIGFAITPSISAATAPLPKVRPTFEPPPRDAEAARLCRTATERDTIDICRAYEEDLARLEARLASNARVLKHSATRYDAMTEGAFVETLR